MNNTILAAVAGAVVASVMVTGCATQKSCCCKKDCATQKSCCKKGCAKVVDNKDFYIGGTFDANGINKGGKFDAAKANQAYYDLMAKFGYPVYPALKNDQLVKTKHSDGSQYLGFWGIDFGLGDFAKYGMGGVIWVDEVKEEYFGHDIFLLPLQSIPEHRHVAQKIDPGIATDRWTGEKFAEKNLPPKMESWLVRHGWVYSFSEVGEPNLDQFPEAKANLSALLFDHKANKPTNLKSLHVEKWEADGVAHKLPKACTWHFMMAGTEGAIVSEFANFHDSKCNRFSVPGVAF